MEARVNKYIFVFVNIYMYLGTVVGQFTQINQECQDPSMCYTLYRGSATWSQAASYCQSINQRLAVIPDQDTQDVISRFAGSGTRDDQLAWVGGRRGRGTPWRDVNDKLAGSKIIRELAGSGRWCSGVRVTSYTPDDGLYALPCQGSYRALCQLPSTSQFEAPRYNISSVCHVVSESIHASWESARAHCNTLHGGELAFSVISIGRWFYVNYPDDTYLWVGFHKRSWVWSSIQALLTYTNWLPSEGVGELDECLVVDLTQNGGWRDTGCDVTHEYVICEGTPTISPPTSAINSTISPQTRGDSEGMAGDSTTTEMTSSDDKQSSPVTPTSSLGGGIRPPLLYYIIGGCAGGVLLLILIVSVAICCKRRKNKEGKHPKHSVVEEGERGTTEMTATTSTDKSSTTNGTAAHVNHPNGTTESSAGLYSSVRHDKRKSGDNIGVNKDGQLENGSLKQNDTDTSGQQTRALENNEDIYNDAEQVRAQKAANKAQCVKTKSVAHDDGSLHKDPVYDGTLEVKKQAMDTSDVEERGSPPKSQAVDDPAEVQVAKLRNPDERGEVESVSRDSDTEIVDNPLYVPA